MRTALTNAERRKIRALYRSGAATQQALAARFRVTQSAISLIVNGRNQAPAPVDDREAA